MNEQKNCTHCKKALPIDMFSRNRATATGYCCYCRKCNQKLRNIYNKKRQISLLEIRNESLKRMGKLND